MPLALIVEDHADLLHLYELSLQVAGWDVETASNLESGMRSIRRRKPDVIFTDLAMPGGDGVDFVSRTRALFPQQRIPIIVVTGQPDLLLRASQRGQPCAACEVLVKPVMYDQLAKVAAGAVGRCGLNCPGAAQIHRTSDVRGCGLQ